MTDSLEALREAEERARKAVVDTALYPLSAAESLDAYREAIEARVEKEVEAAELASLNAAGSTAVSYRGPDCYCDQSTGPHYRDSEHYRPLQMAGDGRKPE